jgi:hypothetical protein
MSEPGQRLSVEVKSTLQRRRSTISAQAASRWSAGKGSFAASAYFIAKHTQAHPNHLYFEELSAPVFRALVIIAFMLPLLASLILMRVVF